MDLFVEGFTSPALEFRSVVPQFRSPERRESDMFENVVNRSFAYTHIYIYLHIFNLHLISQNGKNHIATFLLFFLSVAGEGFDQQSLRSCEPQGRLVQAGTRGMMMGLSWEIPGLVNIQIAIEDGPVEIVDFPMNTMVIFRSSVSLPEGILFFGDVHW